MINEPIGYFSQSEHKWYKHGTISILGKIVTGVDTSWASDGGRIKPGDALILDGRSFEIDQVVSDTQLILAQEVATISDATYSIMRASDLWSVGTNISLKISDHIARAANKAGVFKQDRAPAATDGVEGDIWFYEDGDNLHYYTKVDGAWSTPMTFSRGVTDELTLNKPSTSGDAVLGFATNDKPHAQAGLLGDDNFAVKVSPDGTNFIDAFSIDKVNGILNLAQGLSFGTGQDVMDCYEIGTFTPFFTENTPTATFTHSVQQGNYICVGKAVMLWLTLRTSSVEKNGSNQKLRIGGLPFISMNNNGNHYGGLIFFSKGFSQTSNPKTILYLEGTSSIELETAGTSDSRSEFDVTMRTSHMSDGLNSINAFIPFIAA